MVEPSEGGDDSLFRAVFEEAPTGMAVLDTDGVYLRVNRRFCAMLGYAAEDLVGRSFAELTAREDVVHAHRRWEELRRHGAVSGRKGFVRRDGTRLVARVSASLMRGGEGRPDRVIAQYEDVTELVQAEGRLRTSEARFREAFVNAPFGVVLLGADLRIQEINEAGCAIAGRTQAELLGTDARSFLAAEDVADIDQRRLDLLAGKSVGAFDRKVRRGDGTVQWVRSRAGAIHDVDGTLSTFVVQFVDVTEERRREEARLQLEEELHRTQRLEAMGRMAAGVAHDFNNMLAVILNSAGMARQRAADPRLVELLEAIHSATTRSIALTRQLMILGRQDPTPPETLDLNAAIRGVLSLLHKTAGEDVAVEVELEPALPPVRLPVAHLEQVLLNLVVNARDAQPGGGRVTIRTFALSPDTDAPDGDWVALVCEDEGPGMSDEVLARAFEPFFTTKGSGRGTGLGLSIVYSVVRKAGGHVRVTSAPGRGARFEILLPATAHMPVAPGDEDDLYGLGDDLPTGRGERVLVVEDEPALLSMVTQILEEFGYGVKPFGDPAAALGWLQGGEPVDLLLSDVIMPGLSGADLATEALRARPDLRVLLMSGHTADRLSRHRLGRDFTLLHKPFQAADLLQAIRGALEAR